MPCSRATGRASSSRLTAEQIAALPVLMGQIMQGQDDGSAVADSRAPPDSPRIPGRQLMVPQLRGVHSETAQLECLGCAVPDLPRQRQCLLVQSGATRSRPPDTRPARRPRSAPAAVLGRRLPSDLERHLSQRRPSRSGRAPARTTTAPRPGGQAVPVTASTARPAPRGGWGGLAPARRAVGGLRSFARGPAPLGKVEAPVDEARARLRLLSAAGQPLQTDTRGSSPASRSAARFRWHHADETLVDEGGEEIEGGGGGGVGGGG